MKTIKTGYEPMLHPTTPQEGKRALSKKMNIDEAFGVVCKYLDDYENFLMMVKMMREAQKEYDDAIDKVYSTHTFFGDNIPYEVQELLRKLTKKKKALQKEVDKYLKKM